MEIIKVIALIAVCIIVFIVVVNISTYVALKVTNWLERRADRKWDMNLFTIPARIPELEPYNVTRSIHRTGDALVFTFKAAGNESMRSYRYKNPKEALKRYVQDFQKEERAFFERNKCDLLEDFSTIKLVEQIKAKVDRIESDLNQLKLSLGEKSD